MTRITRDLTPNASLDSLRKMAKRWLKDIRSGDTLAMRRFRDVFPGEAEPALRQV